MKLRRHEFLFPEPDQPPEILKVKNNIPALLYLNMLTSGLDGIIRYSLMVFIPPFVYDISYCCRNNSDIFNVNTGA